MDRDTRSIGWAAVVIALVGAAIAAFFAYNAGLANGAAAAQLPAGTPGALPPYAWYGWHRPWGFGLFGPFLFIAVWFVLLRGLFWGGRWRRCGYYGGGYSGAAAAFDEWHRRAHEKIPGSDAGGSPHDADRPRG
jgi:hypothetical protein